MHRDVSFNPNVLGPDGRPLNFVDSHGYSSMDGLNNQYNNHMIPYDYANIDDYKFVQTPTTPTPVSTPGLTERRFGKFNPHLAHLAGLKFRKESCGSCQKNLNKQHKEHSHKDFRYFCRKCRMLHRYGDKMNRSCDSLDYVNEGSTASCLDRKAFYYTPTHIHLAIISSKTYRPTKELLSFKARQPFKIGSLHDTKSESNLAKFKYSSSRANAASSHVDIFSPNPRRKISDIVCSYSMESNDGKMLPRSPLSTVYCQGAADQQSHSHDHYHNSRDHMMSQTSVNYPSTCSLYSQKDRNLSGSRFFVYPDDCLDSSYLQESDIVLSAQQFMSPNNRNKVLTDNVYPSCSSDHSLPPSHHNHHHMPLSPRLPDDNTKTDHVMHGHLSRYPFASSSSSYSFDMCHNDSIHSGSLASSVSSVRYSPKSLQRLHQSSTQSNDQVFLSRESLQSMPQFPHISEQCEPGSSTTHHPEWYSMTSVNIEDSLDYEDDECEEEEDEVTVAEFKASSKTMDSSHIAGILRGGSSHPHNKSEVDLSRSNVELSHYPTSP